MVEDEIDELFEGALGRKIARSALIVGDSGAAPAPTPSTVPMLPTTATRQDRNVDCGLGAVVEVIRAAPRVAKGRKSVRDGKDDEVEVGSLIYGKQELAVSFFKMCYSA